MIIDLTTPVTTAAQADISLLTSILIVGIVIVSSVILARLSGK